MGYQRITVSNDANKYEAWPGIVQTSDGTLIVSYRTCDTNTHTYDATGHIVMRTSANNGLTWSNETTVMDVADDLDTRTGNLMILDNNGVETLLQTAQVTNSSNQHSLYITYSIDKGVNWSEPELILAGRVSACKPIQLSDDSLIIPVYKVTSNDYTVSIFKSTDYGNSWTEIIVNHSAPIYYNESAIIETTPGNILMVTRWESGTNFIQFTSGDYGITWSEPEAMSFDKYYSKRPSLTKIDDKILFSWNDSSWYNRWDISLDNGLTWHTGIYRLNLIVKGYAGSYPESILLSNGQIGTIACTNGATSDIELILIDSEDILSRLPFKQLNINGQKIVFKTY